MSSLFRFTLPLIVACWAAIVSAQTVKPPAAGSGAMGAAPASVANADYRLGPGDSIKVQVYQNPDLGVEVRVSESGSVNYPLVGPVKLPAGPGARNAVAPLYGLRWPDNAHAENLVATAWVEDATGRITQVATDRCADPK